MVGRRVRPPQLAVSFSSKKLPQLLERKLGPPSPGLGLGGTCRKRKPDSFSRQKFLSPRTQTLGPPGRSPQARASAASASPEDLEVIGVSDLLARIHVDRHGHWSLFSLGFHQWVSVRSRLLPRALLGAHCLPLSRSIFYWPLTRKEHCCISASRLPRSSLSARC